ncbi:MAG: helix-turn-helix domain-containing protein [Treponema sp.]|nr:helix-turn-helix domain-containing protein [Treponema sp.]
MAHLKTILASNIKIRRKNLGFTQETLAEMVNTASTYIAMIESGKRTPSFKMIERIADVLKVDASELFSTAEYPFESNAELREKLLCQFDEFLSAAAKEMKDKAHAHVE